MQWQLFIYTKLNLESKTAKIISDETGILFSNDFFSFLNEKSVNFLVTDKVTEILATTGSNPPLLILTGLRDIPSFITNKITHLHFAYSDIPFNGDIAGILKGLTTESIIQLLNYVYANDSHLVITKNNIDRLRALANIQFKTEEISVLINQINLLLEQVPKFDKVLLLAILWGKLVYLSIKIQDNRYLSFIEQVDSFASAFVLSLGMNEVAFASTPKNPKSVDGILANIKADSKEKIALICFDCMGYAEWFILQEYLTNGNFSFTDTPVFTMLPSVTSISRTAIFHGSRDVYSIKTPGRSDEAKAFANFFRDKETKYFKEQDSITEDSLLGYDCISILYTFFDDLCHSAQFPPNEISKTLYYNAVRAYLTKSAVLETFQVLKSNGFAIYLCSDHGSVVAFGNGQKLDKYLIDSYAKRAVIIPAESADLVSYNKINIPFVDNKLIVLPEGRTMFANKNQIEINHGGITVEEMVVPYIKVK